MATAKGTTVEIVHKEGSCWNIWIGTAGALVAAKIIDRSQLPGEPGNNKISATYYKGALVKKGSNHPYDQNYVSIVRKGKKFEVRKGVSRTKAKVEVAFSSVKNSSEADSTVYPDAKFNLGEKVRIVHADGQFIGVVISRSWSDNPQSCSGSRTLPSGWGYKVTNDSISGENEEWCEYTLRKYSPSNQGASNVIRFPSAKRIDAQPEESESTERSKHHVTRTWFNKQYRVTFRSILQGLLSSGRYDQSDFAVSKAHELTIATLQQFRASEV